MNSTKCFNFQSCNDSEWGASEKQFQSVFPRSVFSACVSSTIWGSASAATTSLGSLLSTAVVDGADDDDGDGDCFVDDSCDVDDDVEQGTAWVAVAVAALALPWPLVWLVENVLEQLVAAPPAPAPTPATGPKRRLAVFLPEAEALARCNGALGVLKPLSNCPKCSGVASAQRSARLLLLRVILSQMLRNFSLTGFRMDSFSVVLMLASEHMESSASLPRNVDASAAAMELRRVRSVLMMGVRSATKLMERFRVRVIEPVRMSFGFLVLAGRANESTDIRETLSKLSRLRFRSFSGNRSSVSISHSLIVSIASSLAGAFSMGDRRAGGVVEAVSIML